MGNKRDESTVSADELAAGVASELRYAILRLHKLESKLDKLAGKDARDASYLIFKATSMLLIASHYLEQE